MKSFRDKKLVDALFRNRFRGEKEIDNVLKRFEAPRPRPKTVRGVRNGQFFRIKIPPRSRVPEVPKLPSPTGPVPKPLQSLPPQVEQAAVTAAATGQQARNRIWEFLKLNGPVLIMNAGSLCTLLAFTRSDVLELRSLSVTGSVCFIVYTLTTPPIKWISVYWTSLFGAVNTWKIVEIINERHSHVEMTQENEECYMKYFMPHGITPKQFEGIEKSAQRITVKKNEPLVKQGQQLEHVYLVVEGSTRASILGRYLTAASATPTAQVEREGGHAGAWIGEMSFLEGCWDKDQGKEEPNGPPNRSGIAMYSVVAKEDCLVWRWSHADMKSLMERSSDMRAALTRAMTSAIVGKVMAFTLSRKNKPSWQTWLDDWKLARVQANKASFDGADTDKASGSSTDIGKESPA